LRFWVRESPPVGAVPLYGTSGTYSPDILVVMLNIRYQNKLQK
jgi:hypothetical protein